MTTVKTYVWLGRERLEFINGHPEVLSILYDLGLLPEEISARVRGYVDEERERCLKIVAQYTAGFDPNHRDPRCGATARAIEAEMRGTSVSGMA